MASYTNLTKYVNMAAGDTITYTSSTSSINFNGCKVKIVLYGKKNDAAAGGKTTFTFDSSSYIGKTGYFNTSGGTRFSFNGTLLGVAGDGGFKGKGTTVLTPENGGGSNSSNTMSSTYYTIGSKSGYRIFNGANGKSGEEIYNQGNVVIFDSSSGIQTGYYGEEAGTGTRGSSSSGGAGATKGVVSGGKGGDGYYGGGGGACWNSGSTKIAAGGGGGAGYCNSSYTGVSSSSLSKGGSTETAAKMVVTIVTAPKTKTVKYNSSTGTDCYIRYYNGSSWVDVQPAVYYNGSFVKNVYYKSSTGTFEPIT